MNAKSKLWHCPIDNKRGIELESLLTKHFLHILNNKKPTCKSSKRILDLSICPNSMIPKFLKFNVLKDKISNHQAPLTSFKIATEKLIFEIHKIDHDLLFKALEYNCPQLILTDAASFDQAAANQP